MKPPRPYAGAVVNEAQLKDTEAGLVPASAGWFVLNARDARWIENPGRGHSLPQWDFVHCPPRTRHAFAATGDRACVLLCASSRQFQKDGPWGVYCADHTAARYNASAPVDTQDTAVAYARFAPSHP